MRNHNKENVSVGPYTFPIEDIDKRILIDAFKLYDSTVDRPEYIASFISESWWKELDNMLRLYGKKGMGFYYGYMMYLNQNKSGEELRNGDINPVIAPGYRVQEQGGAGTHRVGELDGVQMIEIEGVFGLATYDALDMDYGTKTKMEWSIIFDDMGEMKVGPTFIYDYKQYELEPDEIDYWSIGGSNSENLLAVLLSFYRTYGDVDLIREEIDTEIKYAIDQQYRNDPEQRKDVLDALEFDPYEDRDFYVGGYKELQFDVEPRMLVNKLAKEKGYGKVVDEMLGGNGTAYFTSKGNVIKLTGDKSEYETANTLKGKQNKYIADVFESGKLDSSHIVNGEGYIIIMEELGLPKRMAETFDNCCCGVNKPIYIEYDETPAIINPPVDGTEECKKLYGNLLKIRQELAQHGIGWSDIGIDNLGMKNGRLALVDLGETTGGIDTGQSIKLNEQEQLELDLPTPIGEFEFPAGYEDFEQENGEIISGSEQDTVDWVKEQVSDEAVTYLFKKWDKAGINFDDLKLLGIPPNHETIRVMLLKRYLKNTMKPIPVSYSFDCEDLANMFIKDARDYSVDYIKQFLCGDYEWQDYDSWYDTDWYDGMSDDLDEKNWKLIMHILDVKDKDVAENLINLRSQTEEEDILAEEKEEIISEIRSRIMWSHNDEAEWATKKDMSDDVIDKLEEHFEGHGKLERDDNGRWSWTIKDNLLDWLENDMWDNIDVFEYHPDYKDTTFEDWLMHETGGQTNLPQAIFQALMLEEFTFEDYDYGKKGDLLEPNTQFFSNYYYPNYDINESLNDRLHELQYEFDITPYEEKEQIDEETDIFGQGLMDPIEPEEFEGTEEEWEELVKLNEPDDDWQKDDYVYIGDKTDPTKGFVAPSKEVTENICKVEGFCKEQGPITFGQLKALVDQATRKRIQADMGRGAFKMMWRVIPFFIPQILLAAVGVTATRAINKIVTPALKDTKGYKSWWGKVVLKAMDIAEGDYIPDVALGDDPLGKVFFISDGLLQMIKDKYKLKFARYVAEYAASRPDNEPVPDWFVENLLRDYLNQKFLLDPPLQQKRGVDVEEFKPTEYKTINEEYKMGIFSNRKFDRGELLILKHIHKNFNKKELEALTTETPGYGKHSNKWIKLMKMFGIPQNSMDQRAISTQYAKYALDNWNEEGDYTMEDPERNMINYWDVSMDETGSQVEYKSGNARILAFDHDDAEERGANEFHDWDGQLDTYDWGDYEAYESNIEDASERDDLVNIPKISEGVGDDQKKHTGKQGSFFTLDGSDNLGNSDLYKDDGFDIIHQHRGNVHLSDLSPEESETAIPQGTKKVKKTILKPRLDKGPFNIKVKMNEHQGYDNIEDNPDLNPDVIEGDVIELIYMDDPYGIPVKTRGVVMGFEGKPGDFAYKILVNWIMGPESMTPMALLPDADIYRFPKNNLNEQFEKPYRDPKAIVNGREIQLDVADTAFLKQKGMMYKTSYPNNRGMLFLWDDIVPVSMWMKNTFLPLDIIYMVDGEVVDYDKDVQPCEEQQCENYGNVNANQVIELVSGGVDNYNIEIGDKIELVDV